MTAISRLEMVAAQSVRWKAVAVVVPRVAAQVPGGQAAAVLPAAAQVPVGQVAAEVRAGGPAQEVQTAELARSIQPLILVRPAHPRSLLATPASKFRTAILLGGAHATCRSRVKTAAHIPHHSAGPTVVLPVPDRKRSLPVGRAIPSAPLRTRALRCSPSPAPAAAQSRSHTTVSRL